jgi:cell division transport system permease protein
MLGYLLGEALRDLRRAGRVGVSALLLIALSLLVLGGFALVTLNLGRAVAQWRERVRVVAYLREEPASPAQVQALLGRIESIDGVQRLRYVSKQEALDSLKRTLGAQAEVADSLPRNPLPASVEITPDPATATPEGTRELVARVAGLAEVEEVQGGAQWVEGLAQFQRLFSWIGLGVGAVLALAAVLTVTTATTLVLHLRRDEMEIMRLCGATEAVIRLPRVFQGMAQGLAAAIVALAGLEVLYALVVPRLEPLLPVTLGIGRAVFLSVPHMGLLLAGGAALGGLGGALATRRARP